MGQFRRLLPREFSPADSETLRIPPPPLHPSTPHCAQRHARTLTNEEVSGRPHLPVLGDDIDDQGIAHQPHQHDEGKEERHQPGVGEEGVLPISVLLLLAPGTVLPPGGICLGAVDPELLGGVPQPLGRVHGAVAAPAGWWATEERGEADSAAEGSGV